MSKAKPEVLTFKVDEALAEALKTVPNRSEFIRKAILAALENVCPLCQGSGLLSIDQKEHWGEFSRHHYLHQCDDCQEFHLICDQE